MPEDTHRAVRLRPEEILAQTFATPVPPQTNDGWSPKARRVFLAAMAIAGALLVTAGLLLTGELVPGPGSPSPVESGPGAGADLSASLLPIADPSAPQTPASGPVATPTTAPGPRPRTVSPIVAAPTQAGSEPQQPAPSSPTPNAQTTKPNSPIPTPPTTVPCQILGSRALGAQLPPVCR